MQQRSGNESSALTSMNRCTLAPEVEATCECRNGLVQDLVQAIENGVRSYNGRRRWALPPLGPFEVHGD